MSEPVLTSLENSALTVCVDFKNPHAFLANEPTWALVHELNLEPTWLPLIVSPLTPPPAASNDEDRGARHRRLRAAYAEADLTRYAKVRGLTLTDAYRKPDSTAAGVVLLWVNRFAQPVRRRFMSDVFERYWRGALNLEDPAALRAAVVAAGGDADGLEAYVGDEGKAELTQWQSRLNAAGVFNVPAFLVGNEVFYGRAHLPMVRWLLSSKRGAPPL